MPQQFWRRPIPGQKYYILARLRRASQYGSWHSIIDFVAWNFKTFALHMLNSWRKVSINMTSKSKIVSLHTFSGRLVSLQRMPRI